MALASKDRYCKQRGPRPASPAHSSAAAPRLWPTGAALARSDPARATKRHRLNLRPGGDMLPSEVFAWNGARIGRRRRLGVEAVDSALVKAGH